MKGGATERERRFGGKSIEIGRRGKSPHLVHAPGEPKCVVDVDIIYRNVVGLDAERAGAVVGTGGLGVARVRDGHGV